MIEDVENNTLLKEAMKTRVRKLHENRKRKAEEKINSLMRGQDIKYPRKRRGNLQFSLGNLDTRTATRTSLLRKRRDKRKSSKSSVRRKSEKSTKKKKKIQGQKTKKSSATKRCRAKKRSVSNVFS